MMFPIQSVYIVDPSDQGWIIGHLMRDIASELEILGIRACIGTGINYQGQDVIFNSRFLTAISDRRARVNALFVTHVDDRIKEFELRSIRARFNSFVCLSEQDADFVAAVNGTRAGVVGIDLPPRDLKVRPIRLAMFSARYEDGRKNEQWIVEYFRDKSGEYRQRFTFCFLGADWESFCASLAAMEMNYEIYRYARQTPGEYEMYKQQMTSMDALIYLGFDGGAMSVYDAMNSGVDVIASNISYHRDLGSCATLFDDRAGFFRQLDLLYERNATRSRLLQQRAIGEYTRRLVTHWSEVVGVDPSAPAKDDSMALSAAEGAALKHYRSLYKRVSLTRIRSAAIRRLKAAWLRWS